MLEPIKRIHHISAIVGNSQENLTFYRDVLGLKLIKKTVNFDDPNVYHLYFTDQNEDSDAVMTFFPWENAHEGRKGSGQVGRIAFSIPKGTIDYWKDRLASANVEVEESNLFGAKTLEFNDPHTLELALVESWEESTNENILNFYGAVLNSANSEATAHLLTEHLGLTPLESDEYYLRFETVGEEHHHIIVPLEIMKRGRWGLGTVHHIAWSVPTDEEHRAWQDYLMDQGYGVTEIKDRNYFKAIYMKEDGYVIFEFATDVPGFEIDEAPSELGTNLMLPRQYEPHRDQIEAHLPTLD